MPDGGRQADPAPCLARRGPGVRIGAHHRRSDRPAPHARRVGVTTTAVVARRTGAVARRGRLARWPATCWRQRYPALALTRPDVVARTAWLAAVPIPARCGYARSSAPPAASDRRERRNCRGGRRVRRLASRTKSRPVVFPARLPALRRPASPARRYPVPAMPCDPACRWQSAGALPGAHRPLAASPRAGERPIDCVGCRRCARRPRPPHRQPIVARPECPHAATPPHPARPRRHATQRRFRPVRYGTRAV